MMPPERLQKSLALKLLGFAGMLQCNRRGAGASAGWAGFKAPPSTPVASERGCFCANLSLNGE